MLLIPYKLELINLFKWVKTLIKVEFRFSSCISYIICKRNQIMDVCLCATLFYKMCKYILARSAKVWFNDLEKVPLCYKDKIKLCQFKLQKVKLYYKSIFKLLVLCTDMQRDHFAQYCSVFGNLGFIVFSK